MTPRSVSAIQTCIASSASTSRTSFSWSRASRRAGAWRVVAEGPLHACEDRGPCPKRELDDRFLVGTAVVAGLGVHGTNSGRSSRSDGLNIIKVSHGGQLPRRSSWRSPAADPLWRALKGSEGARRLEVGCDDGRRSASESVARLREVALGKGEDLGWDDFEHQRLPAVALERIVGNFEVPVPLVLRPPRVCEALKARLARDSAGVTLDDDVESRLPRVVAVVRVQWVFPARSRPSARQRQCRSGGRVLPYGREWRDMRSAIGRTVEIQTAPRRRWCGGRPPTALVSPQAAEACVELGHRVCSCHSLSFIATG